MENEIDNIFKNSSKAELVEQLTKELEEFDKVVIVLIQDKEDGGYTSRVITLGLDNTYEAYGMIEVARQDLIEGNY